MNFEQRRSTHERPFSGCLQVHLSTAIILMLSASALIYLNTRLVRITITESVFSSDRNENNLQEKHSYYGWPCEILCVYTALESDGSAEYFSVPPGREWFVIGIFVNAAVGLTVLLAIWLVAEGILTQRCFRTVGLAKKVVK